VKRARNQNPLPVFIIVSAGSSAVSNKELYPPANKFRNVIEIHTCARQNRKIKSCKIDWSFPTAMYKTIFIAPNNKRIKL